MIESMRPIITHGDRLLVFPSIFGTESTGCVTHLVALAIVYGQRNGKVYHEPSPQKVRALNLPPASIPGMKGPSIARDTSLDLNCPT